MSTLLLHVGPHKTGSTAIQNMLAENPQDLDSAGLHYELFPGMAQGVHGLADMVSMNRFEEARPLIAALAARQGAARDTIVSSENFSRLNGAQARFLVGALPFDRIRVVYYLRNPLVRLQSAWRERVKHGYRHTLVEFLAGRLLTPFRDNEINDEVRLRPWIAALGRDNVDVHLYDDLPDAAAHFFATYVAADRPPVAPTRRINISPGVEQAEVYRALAGHQVHLLRHREYDDAVRAILDRIAAVQGARDKTYSHSVSLSLDSAILRRIEIGTARIYTRSDSDKTIFALRTIDISYLAPEIWFENPDLMRMVFDLRKRLSDELGQPVFDQRLARL